MIKKKGGEGKVGDLEGQEALVLAEEFAKDGNHIELEEALEIGVEQLVQWRLVFLGSLQRLNRLYCFDAEAPPLLQRLPILASVAYSHRHEPRFPVP
jgi:hypothetical protein